MNNVVHISRVRTAQSIPSREHAGCFHFPLPVPISMLMQWQISIFTHLVNKKMAWCWFNLQFFNVRVHVHVFPGHPDFIWCYLPIHILCSLFYGASNHNLTHFKHSLWEKKFSFFCYIFFVIFLYFLFVIFIIFCYISFLLPSQIFSQNFKCLRIL